MYDDCKLRGKIKRHHNKTAEHNLVESRRVTNELSDPCDQEALVMPGFGRINGLCSKYLLRSIIVRSNTRMNVNQ